MNAAGAGRDQGRRHRPTARARQNLHRPAARIRAARGRRQRQHGLGPSNLIAAGASEADMALCVNRIQAMPGGIMMARAGAVMAELSLPNLGLVADLPIAELNLRLTELTRAIQAMGSPFPDLLLTLTTLTGAAIPYLRISENDLVNLKTGEVKGCAVSDLNINRRART